MENATYTVPDLCQRMGKSSNYIYEQLRRGNIPGWKWGGRWIIPRVPIDNLLNEVKKEKSTPQ